MTVHLSFLFVPLIVLGHIIAYPPAAVPTFSAGMFEIVSSGQDGLQNLYILHKLY